MSATTQTAPRKRAKRGTAAKGTPGARRAAAATAALAAPAKPHAAPTAAQFASPDQQPMLIRGLYEMLPAASEGWTLEGAATWFRTAAVNFKQVYGFGGTIEISALPVAT
jgi:hypothetical protein